MKLTTSMINHLRYMQSIAEEREFNCAANVIEKVITRGHFSFKGGDTAWYGVQNPATFNDLFDWSKTGCEREFCDLERLNIVTHENTPHIKAYVEEVGPEGSRSRLQTRL